MRMRSSLLALSVAAMFLAGCGDDSASDDTPSDSGASSAPAAEAGTCEYLEDGQASKDAELPPAEPISTDQLTVATNRGDLVLTFAPENAPCTVSSFVSLAQQGYFDDTVCHRVVQGFVLQCGDPSATGSGGPGYSFADELAGDETYPAGTLAMANAGPDTNGSQFFVVLEDAQLPPSYTVFGEVDDDGLQVARDIAEEGNGPNGVEPANEVRIESVS